MTGKGRAESTEVRAPAGLVEFSQSRSSLQYQRVSQMAMVVEIPPAPCTEHRASGRAPPNKAVPAAMIVPEQPSRRLHLLNAPPRVELLDPV